MLEAFGPRSAHVGRGFSPHCAFQRIARSPSRAPTHVKTSLGDPGDALSHTSVAGRPLALAEHLSQAPGPDGLRADPPPPLSSASNDATSLLMGFDSSGPAAAHTNAVPDRSRSPPAAHNDAEQTAAFCQMAADWCKLLAADRSVSTTEVGVGTAGLAATLLLAATSPTAAHLLCAGGVANVTGGCGSREACMRVDRWTDSSAAGRWRVACAFTGWTCVTRFRSREQDQHLPTWTGAWYGVWSQSFSVP